MRLPVADTLASRLLLLVVVCLIVGIALTWSAMIVVRVRPAPVFDGEAGRLGGQVEALAASPASLRSALARALSRPGQQLEWVAAMPSGDPDVDTPRVVRVALMRALHVDPSDLRAVPAGPGLAAGVAGPLPDGSAVVVRVPQAARSLFEPVPGLLPLLIMVPTAALICGLAARPVSRSVARFAAAAERFGSGGEQTLLPERGPREVRRATAAFNSMQGRLQRAMTERAGMMAALSHDLRTPLARLRLRAEFLAEPRERERMLRDLDEMQAMVGQSLEFLRHDTSREAKTRLDLAVLLQGIAEEQGDLGRTVTFCGPAHATVSGRPLSLKRALTNVVENAVHYGACARIDLSCDDEGAVIAVRDDGPGIPAALRERVFEPFFRAEMSRNRETGGVGLGLSIARAVVLAHGGEIVLADHAEGGFVVRVALPATA